MTTPRLKPPAQLAGRFLVSGDPGWDEARLAWNLAVDQRPLAVTYPEAVEDVVAVVELARSEGLRVAVQCTGHNAAPVGSLERAILLKTERMRQVEIDPVAGTARCEAGVLWPEVGRAAAEHGLAPLAGTSPDVGVVGYTIGGGVSWLGRKHGLAANSVLAVELVTAGGDFVRADRDNEPDLFWALRGGGGSFGIVTALEFALYPVAELFAGALFWPIERAGEMLVAWREWVEAVPDEVTSIGRLLQFPSIPDVAEPFRGRSFVAVEAALLTDEADGAGIARPLRELGPELDTFAVMPPTSLTALHMDPEHPVPVAGNGGMLSDLSADAIRAAVEAFVGSSLLTLELRQLGGALAVAAPGNGALASLAGRFLYFAAGIAPTPEAKLAVERDVDLLQAALAPCDAGLTILNFMERPTEPHRFFPPDVLQRLREIRKRVDPDDRLQANHPV